MKQNVTHIFPEVMWMLSDVKSAISEAEPHPPPEPAAQWVRAAVPGRARPHPAHGRQRRATAMV